MRLQVRRLRHRYPRKQMAQEKPCVAWQPWWQALSRCSGVRLYGCLLRDRYVVTECGPGLLVPGCPFVCLSFCLSVQLCRGARKKKKSCCDGECTTGVQLPSGSWACGAPVQGRRGQARLARPHSPTCRLFPRDLARLHCQSQAEDGYALVHHVSRCLLMLAILPVPTLREYMCKTGVMRTLFEAAQCCVV